jgi:hypothetical protein
VVTVGQVALADGLRGFVIDAVGTITPALVAVATGQREIVSPVIPGGGLWDDVIDCEQHKLPEFLCVAILA